LVSAAQEWKECALELASAENNVLDLRLHRRSIEGRRRRMLELYKDGVIDRVEFDREMRVIENQLKTIATVNVTLAELSVVDFERFGSIWDAATPEKKSDLLARMIEGLYVDFNTAQLFKFVPRAGFRYVFEGAGIAKPLAHLASGRQLTIGDPEGIRTPDLHRDRVAC
jgi:hypothetical protein